MDKIELFISHSSNDKDIVEDFVDLIAGSFVDVQRKIRCSSVERFDYNFGTKLLEEIRKDIEGSIVIAFITKNTKLSEWVLVELGVAMTIAKNTVVALISDDHMDDVPKFLRGRSLYVNISEENKLDKLINEIQSDTGWNIQPYSFVKKKISTFLEKISQKNTKYPIQSLLKRKGVFEERNNLKWSQIANIVQQEITIIGWSCRNVFSATANVFFKKIAEKGVKINVIVMKVEAISNTPLNFGPVCNHRDDPDRIIEDCNKGLEAYQEFIKSLSSRIASNVQLIETDYVLTWSAVAFDIDSNNGVIQIEFYHYENPTGNHLEDRPNLILTNKSEFYEGFKNSIKAIKDSASYAMK